MNDYSEKVFNMNRKYEINNYNGLYNGITYLKIVYGNLPILLSAPHSVKQVRNNKIKKSDGLTGAIVEYLAKLSDTYGITRICNLLDDPNYLIQEVVYNIKKTVLN